MKNSTLNITGADGPPPPAEQHLKINKQTSSSIKPYITKKKTIKLEDKNDASIKKGEVDMPGSYDTLRTNEDFRGSQYHMMKAIQLSSDQFFYNEPIKEEEQGPQKMGDSFSQRRETAYAERESNGENELLIDH